MYQTGIWLLQYVSLELWMMDGKTVRNMYSVISKKKIDILVHLVVFTIEINILWCNAP